MNDNKDEAIPLLIYDHQSKNFTLSEKGEAVLKNLKSPFGVIAVAGMYRTGKSYLLNRMLLNRSNGFSVGPSINPCTKGLWMWSKPITSSSDEFQNMPLMLIDTEGFGAFDEDHNHDIRIFTLAILLSSYFIYNSLGSIDENAIQSLSFVINLSKHIQVKSNEKYSNEPDPNELASLFPSFLWVLRDFSLQLVDDNGEQITAKEYLEKVLENQNTPNEYEQKNKIRKLIRTYFKDRDCHTLVRPLMGEDQLQSLEKMPFDKLRPEFLDQVLSLRKKVLSKVKPKLFKAKYLNGEMFVNVIKSYITAINSGMIPNIENTWVSMCKVESHKALDDAERFYEDYLKDKLDTMVINEQNFKTIHKEAKDKCIEIFRKKAVGDIAQEFEKHLKNKIKEKFNYYVQINEEETKNSLIKLLQKWYSILEYKIHSKELKSLVDIENEFKQIEYKVNEAYTFFKQKNELLNNFKYKVMLFTCDFMNNINANEINHLLGKMSELNNKYTQEINESKVYFEKDINKKNNQIEGLKAENIEFKVQINKLKENIALLQKDTDQMTTNMTDKIYRQKEEYERKLNELSNKVNFSDDKQKESEKRSLTIKCEAEKQKVLLEQRIEHFQKQIDDYSKREKDSVHELRSQIKEQQQAIKDNVNKYENQMKSLSQLTEQLKERCIDLESMVSSKENQLEFEKNKNEELSIKNNFEIDEYKDKLNSLKQKQDQDKNRYFEEIKNKENEWNSKNNLLKIRYEELELKIKNNDDNSKAVSIKLERDNAILRQNNEFLDLQIKELNNQLEEQKRSHDSILAALESRTSSLQGQEEYIKKIDELKNFFNIEKKQMEENFEKSKQLYISQIDSLTERSNELECKAKIEKEDILKELNDAKQKFDRVKRDYENCLQDNKNLSENALISNEELQKRLKKFSLDNEKKLEEKEQKHQREISELNKNSEETVFQMKSLFETEKIRFEEKLKDERNKTEKKLKNLTEEYESKLREQETELKEEIENLSNDLQAEVNNHHDYVSHAEHEIGLLQQKIETLEHFLNEAREALNKVQTQSTQQMEKDSENYKRDKTEFQLKIETLTLENNTKDKEITSLRMKKDQLDSLVLEKEAQISSMKKEYDDDKKDIMLKMDNYKQKFTESNDDFMLKKLEFIRESALLKQQIEFLEKKIEDLNKSIEENQKRYEEKLFSLRSEVEREMSEKNERIKKEKDEIEAKLFAKKKEVRESEQNYLKQISILEKEKAILNEKLSSSEIKKKELIENYEKEIDNLNNTYRSMKDEKLKDSDYSGMQIDELRKRCSFLEITVSEKQSLYEKDKLLWEGRFKFLESQKDQSKKEQSENSKKFETLLENLQKKSSQEKEKIETNYQSQLSNMEQKFQNQIKELNENYTKINTELITSNKELEREIKSLNIEMDLRGKNLNSNDYDKKVTEMLNIQDKMKKEIDVLRREKEEKINEIITQYDKEKDILKNKNYEIENKLRELESKRGQLLLESEKEKAKYSLERDHYESKVKDLQESLEKQDKKIETLLRDNEKLKNEKNAIKRPGSQSTIGRGVNLTQNTSIIGQTPSNYNISDKPLIPSSTYNKDPITFTSNYSNLVNNMGSKLPITNNSPFRKNFNLDNSVNLNDNSTNNDLNNSINSNVSFNKPHKYSLKPTTKYDDDKTKKYEDEKKK